MSKFVNHYTITPAAAHAAQTENGKNNFEFQRIAFDRSKMSEEEAFEHAIEMIQTRQMGFRKAADFFSVSNVVDIYYQIRLLSFDKICAQGLHLSDSNICYTCF